MARARGRTTEWTDANSLINGATRFLLRIPDFRQLLGGWLASQAEEVVF